MSEKSQTMKQQRWALLVGVNFYPKGISLKGAVRDVQKLSEFLESGRHLVDIVSLTGSEPSEPWFRNPAEEPDLWPTFENVTLHLDRIIREAKPGDFVYIHFSGHGTRTPADSEYSNENTGDLALLLFDPDFGERYFYGVDLAYFLHDMVQKGLLVTVVLDCCFSGRVVRGDTLVESIRTVKYNPEIAKNYPSKSGSHLSQGIPPHSSRDVSLLPTWLIHPDGYTILTACGPGELAQELMIDNAKQGALSYFLKEALTTLRKVGVVSTHQSIYQIMCSMFLSYWPRQNPMRYGNPDLAFFDQLVLGAHEQHFSVFKKQGDSTLYLEAGEAHGICLGDEYMLFTNEKDANMVSEIKNKAIVKQVGKLTSELSELEGPAVKELAETGWKAKPLTHLVRQKIGIRLVPSEQGKVIWPHLPQSSRFLQFLVEEKVSQPTSFHAECKEENQVEILDDQLQTIITLRLEFELGSPLLGQLRRSLEHLAMAKFIENLENHNPSSTLEQSFQISLRSSNDSSVPEPALQVNEGDSIVLSANNMSNMTLYLHIYNIGPQWDVAGAIPKSGGGDYIAIPPKNEADSCTGQHTLSLKSAIPPYLKEANTEKCRDVIKVFITTRPTSFRALELPKLHTILQSTYQSRGRNDYGTLSEFLSSLKTPSRGHGPACDEDWITRKFFIFTHSRAK